MSFNLLILRTGGQSDSDNVDQWPDLLRDAIPDIEVNVRALRRRSHGDDRRGRRRLRQTSSFPEVFEKQTQTALDCLPPGPAPPRATTTPTSYTAT